MENDGEERAKDLRSLLSRKMHRASRTSKGRVGMVMVTCEEVGVAGVDWREKERRKRASYVEY